MWRFFFPTTPLTSTSLTPWVSYNWTQFWHCPPRDSIRFHRVRAQSHKTTLHIRHQSQAQVVTLCIMLLNNKLQIEGSYDPFPGLQTPVASPHCYPYLWPTSYKSEVPMTPSLGSINLLEQLTECRKPVCSLDYQFMTKDVKGYKSTTRWRDTKGKVLNKGASVLMEFGAQHGGTWKSSGSPT